jgi:hypothetical protein
MSCFKPRTFVARFSGVLFLSISVFLFLLSRFYSFSRSLSVSPVAALICSFVSPAVFRFRAISSLAFCSPSSLEKTKPRQKWRSVASFWVYRLLEDAYDGGDDSANHGHNGCPELRFLNYSFTCFSVALA